MELIAITGGIGSGKSVVAGMLHVMGYAVYDCDYRAKALMTESDEVRQQLVLAFGNETYLNDGSLNREHLSAVAFSDPQALTRLNAIVHPATASDMLQWCDKRSTIGDRIAFVETALLRTSSLDQLVDQVWHVTAPPELRIQRVIARSGLSSRQVKERMAAQSHEDAVAPAEKELVNDGVIALLPQVISLLEAYN